MAALFTHFHAVTSASALCCCRLVPSARPTLCFFPLPLMDFHSRFSRKAEFLASFLTHLFHPIPTPQSNGPV